MKQAGYVVAIIEPPVALKHTPFSPDVKVQVQLVSIDHVTRATQKLTALYSAELPIHAVGHSHGGAVLMEGLDFKEAENNPFAELPPEFTGFKDFASVVVLGSQLEPSAMGMAFHHRSAGRALSKPKHTRLKLIAAEYDTMASPDAVLATSSRFGRTVEFELIDGGNHLGWLQGEGEHDRPDLDGEATISREIQHARTAEMLISFFESTL